MATRRPSSKGRNWWDSGINTPSSLLPHLLQCLEAAHLVGGQRIRDPKRQSRTGKSRVWNWRIKEAQQAHLPAQHAAHMEPALALAA